MGIFGNAFKGSDKKEKKKSYIQWIALTDKNQLDEIKKQSNSETVLLFKHSTRCGISRMVIKQFENLFDETHKDLKVYYLDLLNHRNISNEIAEQFQVMHQSPQLIVVKNETTVAHFSHYDITQINLEKYKS